MLKKRAGKFPFSKKKKIITMNKIIHILLLLASGSGLLSCSSSGSTSSDSMNAVPVDVYKVSRQQVSFNESYPATMVALKEVRLRSEVSGYITGIFFREGQPVKKGAKLYEIDRTNYLAGYNQAKSGVEIARANLDKAKRDADRYTALHEQEAVAEQTYDDAMTGLKNAQLQLMSAQAALQKATNDLKYSVINAPFDGTIGISQVRIGTLVSPGQTLLNTISMDDPMGIDFEVNAEEISRFQKLEREHLPANDSIFRIALPDKSVYPFTGRISIIDRAFDPQTGTITVRLAFPNRDRLLKPGMSCNVLVYNNPENPKVVIPYKAVLEQMGEYFVFRVNDNKVKQVKITLGQRLGGNIIVEEGLSANDVIVTNGVQKLHDGSEVQSDPAGSE